GSPDLRGMGGSRWGLNGPRGEAAECGEGSPDTRRGPRDPSQSPPLPETPHPAEDKVAVSDKSHTRYPGRSSTRGRVEQGMIPDSATTYDASKIRVMKGREGVRQTPAMYIGSTGARGLHHLIYE